MSLAQPISSAAQYQTILERDEAREELAQAQRGVTVCITYHNEPFETLCRALDSAAGQTVAPFEIIVVDDGSEEPLGLVGSDVRVVRVTNRGLPAARNTALMLTRTVGFLPLDADDWLDPTYIEKTLQLLLRGADVVLTGLQEHGPTRNGTYMPGYDRPWHLVTREQEIEMNRFYYCNTAEAPVWMGDMTFRPIAEVSVGDEIVGWTVGMGKSGTRSRLTPARVLATHHRMAAVVRVVLASGREVRCTADHLWLTPVRRGRGETYAQARVGQHLSRVIDPESTARRSTRVSGYLAGLYDGEGTGASITQSPAHNPGVCAALRAALTEARFEWAEHLNKQNGCLLFRIAGGRQALTRFVNEVGPTRLDAIRPHILKAKFKEPDRVVRVIPDGRDEVVSLQTSTGNYTAWGYASKNCSLFRTQTLREVGGYNPLMAGAWNQSGGYEDHDLWIDLMTRGAKFDAVEEVLFHYSTESTDSMVHRAAQNRNALLAEIRRHHRLDN